MLPPIVLVILTLELLMAPTVDTSTAHEPYDGPLHERRITGVDPNYSLKFEFIVDSPGLAAFERRVRRDPIYVLVPGEKYLGWGLVAHADSPGGVYLTSFNLLLAPEEQPLGPYRASTADGISWAWSVLDHHGLSWDPQKHQWPEARHELIESYRRGAVPVDWKAVADRLRSTGRPVPDDLFDEHP